MKNRILPVIVLILGLACSCPVLAESPNRARIAVLITLTPRGFEPAEATIHSEPFLLALDNRTHLPQLQVQISQANGSLLKQKAMPRGKLKWREFLDLAPGVYYLTEASHPLWKCTITVGK